MISSICSSNATIHAGAVCSMRVMVVVLVGSSWMAALFCSFPFLSFYSPYTLSLLLLNLKKTFFPDLFCKSYKLSISLRI